MNTAEPDNVSESISSSFRPPKWTLWWTLFSIGAIVFISYFLNWLNETTNIQPGVFNIFMLFLVFVTAIVWLCWLTFFSGLKLRGSMSLVVIGLIALFFYQFRVIFDGDVGFVRIEPRFIDREFSEVETATAANTADLATTSEYDFSQFLGNERRDSMIENIALNPSWQEHSPKVLWRQPLGEGWSGFAAVNGYAVTQEQRGQDECVTCYEIATGELKWIHAVPRRHEDKMAMGKVGPRATPTIHNGLVYAQGATGVLECINGSDGELLWSVDIPELLGTTMESAVSLKGLTFQYEDTSVSSLAWGRSSSPLIYKDKVIVGGGVCGDGKIVTLLAFDHQTGEEVWRGGTDMIAYGSPALTNLLGRDQITIVAEAAAVGFDPETGGQLWRTMRSGNSNGDANTAQVTRISDNRIILSKGYAMGGELLELSAKGSEIETKTLWKSSRVLKTKMMSPVIRDGYAYCLSDGFLECCDLGDDGQQGRRKWRKRGRLKSRFGNGQLLLVGEHLLVHTEYGILLLVEATPDRYVELGQIETIDGICWNTLCLYKNYLLVRSELEVACIELKLDSTIDEGVTSSLSDQSEQPQSESESPSNE